MNMKINIEHEDKHEEHEDKRSNLLIDKNYQDSFQINKFR